MRFIKPSKKFYSLLMSVWMGFDSTSLAKLDFRSYHDSVKDRIGLMKWKEEFKDAVSQFYQVAKEEYDKIREENGASSLEVSDYTAFFTNVKNRLLDTWNENIVFKIKESSS